MLKTRRQFLRDTAYLTAGAAFVPIAGCNEMQAGGGYELKDSDSLKGFIVSDAHFGWKNEQQPSPEMQAAMIRRISRRFPDLDVFIDTGDAHHNGKDRDYERGQWTDIIMGMSNPVPFYYVPGNHEICHANHLEPEITCNKLGSLSCRPYYSFDLKGIHFISIPEMVRAVYINKETLEWVRLDMEANKDKTTILLSHNNIRGTTYDQNADGYRGLVNSNELMDLIDSYPNAVGWLHGHNHTYEVVKKNNTLFVSNGRIGGFDPTGWDGEYGQGNLGGIYFEFTKDRFLVRCYSAEKEVFLDELGLNQTFKGVVDGGTTLDRRKKPAYSFGYGGARDGQMTPAYIYHAGGGKATLLMTGTDDELISEDPTFKNWMARKTPRGDQWQLMGSSVSGKHQYKWLDPGLEINAQDSADKTTSIMMPRQSHHDRTYFRCPPGRKYRYYLKADSTSGGQKVQVVFRAFDRNAKPLAKIDCQPVTLKKGTGEYSDVIELPELTRDELIYNDSSSDNVINLCMETNFSNLTEPVKVEKLYFAFADAKGATENCGVEIEGKKYMHKGRVEQGDIISMPVPAQNKKRFAYRVHAGGSGRVTWLIRQEGVEWQVRNAPAADMGGYLDIGPMTNTWTHNKEIVTVPMYRTAEPFVSKMTRVSRCRLYPASRTGGDIRLEIVEAVGPVTVDVVSDKKPKAVAGALDWAYEKGMLRIKAREGAAIMVSFA